jgi:hypothetical protein
MPADQAPSLEDAAAAEEQSLQSQDTQHLNLLADQQQSGNADEGVPNQPLLEDTIPMQEQQQQYKEEQQMQADPRDSVAPALKVRLQLFTGHAPAKYAQCRCAAAGVLSWLKLCWNRRTTLCW